VQYVAFKPEQVVHLRDKQTQATAKQQPAREQTKPATGNEAVQPGRVREPVHSGSGGQSEQAVSAERVDPVVAAAHQAVLENPHMMLDVGTDADGNPIKISAADALKQVQDEYNAGVADSKAFQAAVTCFFRRGG